MTEVTIRSAALDDVPGIQRVARESWHAAHDHILDPAAVDRQVDEWYATDPVTERVTMTDVHVFVADADDVVGFASGVAANRADHGELAELATIYVHPDWWGERVGSRLLERVEDEMRERGFSELSITVLSENQVGLSFYRKHGYEVVSETETGLAGQTVRECELRGSL
ncbi:GNAT family N-acetyltransferase [Haloarchaeobius sp. TZWWS8]|uniref:GNAT family N-acetyltransferase n=1 Tax=Haloarchaeobius sp. TZWWS8 TaxID=3446121 RepID=UPI003EC136DB